MIASLTLPGPVAVVGDIHGRSDMLAALLRHLPVDVPLLVLGDLCDRGPDTRGVLDLLIERGARGVHGNHELWFRDWIEGFGFEPFALSRAMGGEATLRSYGITSRVPIEIHRMRDVVPAAHRAFIASLPQVLDLTVGDQKYWLIHAGLPLTRSFRGVAPADVVPWLAEKHPMDLLWPANEPEMVPPVDRPVIMGHMPRMRPYNAPHLIAVDTGCATMAGGRLTAVLLPERRFLSVG